VSREKPILFSGSMVRAILEGWKVQTRRVVKPSVIHPAQCPFGQPGDRLWVRETFGFTKGNGITTVYRADGVKDDSGERTGWWFGDRFIHGEFGWVPSIHMPRHKSRITLEITGVRVERLQDISEEDAKAEGVIPFGPTLGKEQRLCDGGPRTQGTHPYTVAFGCLWDSLAKPGSTWADNPFVWVVEFKKL